MRTTINLDDAILDELRRRSRAEDKPMGQVASELLARALAHAATPDPGPFSWTTAAMGEPFVDLEDDEALRAAMADGS